MDEAIGLSAMDVLEMAERIEVEGAAFYRQAAAATDDDSLRELLRGLAEMEELHTRHFRSMKESAREVGMDPSSPDGQVVRDYLRTWIDGDVVVPGTGEVNEAARSGSPERVLSTAMGLEKDSIAFYAGIREFVEEDARELLGKIIIDELGHMVDLSRMWRRL